MSTTPACVTTEDVTQPEHNRCPGATYESPLGEGTPCGCPCHTLPRCFSVFAGHGASAYFCDLHVGHGGNFHRDRFVLWSRGHHKSPDQDQPDRSEPPDQEHTICDCPCHRVTWVRVVNCGCAQEHESSDQDQPDRSK